MFPVWSRVFILVTVVHLLALRFCWVGMAVPRPSPQASFSYLDRAMILDNAQLTLEQEKAFSIDDSNHLNQEELNWQILQQPKKVVRDVRLGL